MIQIHKESPTLQQTSGFAAQISTNQSDLK